MLVKYHTFVVDLPIALLLVVDCAYVNDGLGVGTELCDVTSAVDERRLLISGTEGSDKRQYCSQVLCNTSSEHGSRTKCEQH